jgi:hypothetical protein
LLSLRVRKKSAKSFTKGIRRLTAPAMCGEASVGVG